MRSAVLLQRRVDSEAHLGCSGLLTSQGLKTTKTDTSKLLWVISSAAFSSTQNWKIFCFYQLEALLFKFLTPGSGRLLWSELPAAVSSLGWTSPSPLATPHRAQPPASDHCGGPCWTHTSLLLSFFGSESSQPSVMPVTSVQLTVHQKPWVFFKQSSFPDKSSFPVYPEGWDESAPGVRLGICYFWNSWDFGQPVTVACWGSCEQQPCPQTLC